MTATIKRISTTPKSPISGSLVSVHQSGSGLPWLLEQREKHLERTTLKQRVGHASREMENLTGLDFILLTVDRDAHRAFDHEHRGVRGPPPPSQTSGGL